MSLTDKFKIIERESKQKKIYYVFYEGDEAERSLVNELKKNFRKCIITPIDSGIQISNTDIVNHFKEIICDNDYDLMDNDKIVYLCDFDNILEVDKHKENILSILNNDKIDLYYTYPCIELLCFICCCNARNIIDLTKEEIKRDKNKVCEKCNCFKNTRFSDKFISYISDNNFNDFIKNSKQLYSLAEATYGDFKLDKCGKKFVEGKLNLIVNSKINVTTLHMFIEELLEL